jgi:RNA polymerase sigma factor (sigma-70 family)
MTQEHLATVLRHLRRLADAGPLRGLSDGQLLERFTAAREEAAFDALVQRHGPLVLGVCRRILRHEQDAEDAFQATFLVLARKAGSIRKGEAVGSWLYGVARRLALKAQVRAARQQDRDRSACGRQSPGPASELALRELQTILDEEVSRLPEKFRAPFVLCCLEGKSKPEAARDLGCKEGTLSWRLGEARRQLQQRLTRRGVALSAALCAVALGQTSATAVPAGLSSATVQAALPLAAGGLPMPGTVSAQVITLARTALPATATAPLKVAVTCVLALGAALAAGVGWLFAPSPPAEDTRAPNLERPRGLPVNQAKAVLRRAAAELRLLTVSQDGKRLAGAGHNDNVVRLWDTATGKELWQFRGHATPVRAVALTADAALLVSGDDHDLRLWRTATGQEIYRLGNGTAGSVTALAFTPDGKGLAAGGRDGQVRLWDVAAGKLLFQARGHSAAVAALAFSRAGRLLASGDADGTLVLWTMPGGQLATRWARRPQGVLCLALSPDGKSLAWGGRDQTLRLRERDAGQDLWFGESPADILVVAFAPDGKWLATGNALGGVHLWEAATGKIIRQLGRQSGRVYWLSFSDDGKRLLTGTDAPRVRLWDVATGKELDLPSGHPRETSKRASRDDIPSSALGLTQKEVSMFKSRQWLVLTAAAAFALGGEESRGAEAKAKQISARSPDGKLVAVADGKSIHFLDNATGKELRRLAGHQDRVTALAFSPDGKVFVSGGADRSILLWDIATGKILAQMKGHAAAISSVTFSPDGKTLLTKDTDKKTLKWDAATGQLLKVEAKAKQISARSPDGKLVAVADGKSIHFLDNATGKELRRLAGHQDRVTALAFSPDGKVFVSGSADRLVLMWDIPTGKILAKMQGHQAAISSVAFSPDARSLITTDTDKKTLTWDPATGRLLKKE